MSGPARSLLVELGHPSRLVRHVGLCRLLHGARQLGPDELELVGARLPDTAEHSQTVATITALAQLRRAAEAKLLDATALQEASVAAVAEHGYRVACGTWGR